MKAKDTRWCEKLKLFILLLYIFTGHSVAQSISQATKYSNSELHNFDFVIEKIEQYMAEYHYNPAELKLDSYRQTKAKVHQLIQIKQDKQAFIDAFNQIWQQGPFSHVRLDHASLPAEKLADYLDHMKVGEQVRSLKWQGKIAVLKVDTMMGNDTIDFINQAYSEIVSNRASALIIDLRDNHGGAFAVKPLVGHLLQKSLNSGVFVSQKWHVSQANQEYSKQAKVPILDDYQTLPAWQGWSIKSFWRDVQTKPVTKIQFVPMQPMFAGPVYVLISKYTASAAELATDALANLPNVTLIGERTAGQMLSQIMFDLPDNLQLFLPIADYYSVHSGRIEGRGVLPDIKVDAENALDKALSIATQEYQ